MAHLTIDIPDDQLDRVLDAYAAVHGYQASAGQTKQAFLEADLTTVLVAVVAGHEGGRAAETARVAAVKRVADELGQRVTGPGKVPLATRQE